MSRHELTDEQFNLILPLLPRNGGRGGQWRDHRTVFNGIFYRLHTGVPWRDVPERYGPWKTLHRRFLNMVRDGTIDRICEALRIRLDEKGLIDWEVWSVDGSNVRAARSAAGGRKKGAAVNQKTTLWAAREAGLGPSSTWLLTATEFPSMSTSPPARPTSRKQSKRS